MVKTYRRTVAKMGRNLYIINDLEIEQVEVTKLLGVTLDWKLSWSKHIDTTVAKMGRGLSIFLFHLYLTR